MPGIQLRIETEHTLVDVHYDPLELATEQFKSEEKQRVVGIIPHFYVSYESDRAPLTTKTKFELALKVSPTRLLPPESLQFLLPSKLATLPTIPKAGEHMESTLAQSPPMVFLTS